MPSGGFMSVLASALLAAVPVWCEEISQLLTMDATISVPKGCETWFDFTDRRPPAESDVYTDDCHWYEGGSEANGRYWEVSLGEMKMGMTPSARKTLKHGSKEERMSYLEKDHANDIADQMGYEQRTGVAPSGYPTPPPVRVLRENLPEGMQSCFLTDRFVRDPDPDEESMGDLPFWFERELDCFHLTDDASAVSRIWVTISAKVTPDDAQFIRRRVIEASAPIFSTLRAD
jgi:hypothetical protein